MMYRSVRARVGGLLLALGLHVTTASGPEAATRTGIPTLDAAAAAVSILPTKANVKIAAAHVSQEGHWTLVNAAGEAFTAATPGELKRGFQILLPDLPGQNAKLNLYLTADSIFTQRPRLDDLPRDATLWLAGPRTTRLIALPATGGPKLLAEVRTNLLVELTDAQIYADIAQQLARPLERSGFRLLSIEPGGPQSIPARPRVDRATGRTLNDPVDPNALTTALSALSGQTAVIVGRLDTDALVVKPSSAPERQLRWSELTNAATASDVNLLILKSSAAPQPGGRNWLWQKVEVKGLENALSHATLGDFLDALGSPTNRLVLTSQPTGDGRLILDITRATGLPSTQSSTAQVGSILSDMVSGLTGKVVHEGALLHMRSARRQAELDRRLLPFLPSLVSWSYVALFALGLTGLPVAWGWWAHLWPIENAKDYHNAVGYNAARAMRGLAFGLLFLPAVAIAAGPTAIGRAIARSLRRNRTATTRPGDQPR
jgi:hypothetical protein